jgi:hypothetical protein
VAFDCDFSSLNEGDVTSFSIGDISKGYGASQGGEGGGCSWGKDTGIALRCQRNGNRGGEGERPKLRLRRIAGVGLGLFSNDPRFFE